MHVTGTRAHPVDDDDADLADEAPPTLDGEPDLGPDPDPGLAPDLALDPLLHDEAQHAGSDLGDVAPDPAAEADLLDAAPLDPDDPDPDPDPAPPPPPRPPTPRSAPASPAPAFSGAWREPALPPRRVARRSARDELMADLPAPTPTPASGLQIKVSPRPTGEQEHDEAAGDVVDALPPEVRVRVLEARSRRDERMAAAVTREVRRRRTVAAGMALLGLLSGAVTGSLVLPTTWAVVGAALADAALLGAAGWLTYLGGGGALRGLGAFGLAAVLGAGLKVGLGAIDLQGMTDVASFALLVGLTLAATLLGGAFGQRLDQLVFEDGT